MIGEQFTPKEQALIERLQNAPHAHLRVVAVDAIRQRMFETLDTLPVPESAPNWIRAHLPIVVGIVVALIMLVAVWIFSRQVSPGLVETATPHSDNIMITETSTPEVTTETTETLTPEVTAEITETPAPFSTGDAPSDTPNANSVTTSAWHDDGTCNNPPPNWAPASGWRRRCAGGSQGTNPGGNNPGQGNNNGNNDSGGNRGQGKGNS